MKYFSNSQKYFPRTGCWLVAGRHTTAAARGVLRLRWLQLVTVGRARETDGASWRRHGRRIQQETGQLRVEGIGFNQTSFLLTSSASDVTYGREYCDCRSIT